MTAAQGDTTQVSCLLLGVVVRVATQLSRLLSTPRARSASGAALMRTCGNSRVSGFFLDKSADHMICDIESPCWGYYCNASTMFC